MRILMLSWEYPPHIVGGIGTHVSALVPALARRDVQVTVLTPRLSRGEPELDIDPNLRIVRIDPPLSAIGNIYVDAMESNRAMETWANANWSQIGAGDSSREGGFDLVHAHDWLVAFAGIALKRSHKVPLVATFHATERGRSGGHLNWEMSRSINQTEWSLAYEAWRVITVSRSMMDEVIGYFQLPRDKIEVVPNGVDTQRFDRYGESGLASFRENWAKQDEQIVFFVGRLESQKGPHLLVESAPRVISQFPNAKFIIAGTGTLERSLKTRIEDLGLGDKVRITGFISDSDRDKLYKVADVAVFPSVYEPFGIVALEAMAAGCPVVVSNVGGLKEVVENNETGIVVFPENVESLTWGIVHTLRRRDWASVRAQKAYRKAREELGWDRIAERTAGIYERVVRERCQVRWE